MEKDIDPWDDKGFLKLTLRHLGLKLRDWDKLKYKDNVIEILDKEGRQIFRNLSYMERSSYSLLEVLSYSYTQLFYRPKGAQSALNAEIARVFRGVRSNPKKIPEHRMIELMAIEKTEFLVKIVNVLPVYSGREQVSGVLIESEWKILDAKAIALSQKSKKMLADIFSTLGFG